MDVSSSYSHFRRDADPNLRTKRSWDLALGPLKQVPMNLFMMYMSGNSISIFPIMMVGMMIVRYDREIIFFFIYFSFSRPVKTLFTVGQTFKGFEVGANGVGVNIILQKMVFILGNLAGVALAMYKCHSMGLLPTHKSDWLAFADPLVRTEYGLGGIGFN